MTTEEISPAQRYSASRARSQHPILRSFCEQLRFDLDHFQREACERIELGRNVLVAAPTGAGKTVVAEFAVFLAMRDASSKIFYTTPMKALSNQKYHELVSVFGHESVGLLTGDTALNACARIVVMTTEVLRNMLYTNSDALKDLAFVVLDEVHYLGDRFRGPVWEEVIIHLPSHIRMVSLSATVSNAEEFGDWLQAVRGQTDVILSEERPVPLQQHVLLGSRLFDLFSAAPDEGGEVNPELHESVRLLRTRTRGASRGSAKRYGKPAAVSKPRRTDVVSLLNDHMLLPAIFFVFSRVGCESAVNHLIRDGVCLTSAAERSAIREIVEERTRTLPDEDLAVVGYWSWRDGLERGIAAHHAGLLPTFKEVVEELFRLKLVKVVFATETLALGINMPARSVVLEKLEKFNGEARVPITSGEYTQLTGRAGRRGIDVEGHCVVVWEDSIDPHALAALASKRSYPLRSSFRPTYNMAVNLIDQFGLARAREILESSFAQFQADRAVVDLATSVRKNEESLDGYRHALACDRGDFYEYSAIRRELTDLERKANGAASLSHADRERRNARLEELRRQLRLHPCHRCPERESHARWAQRWWTLKRSTDSIRKQIQSRTGAIAVLFDRVCEVLVMLDYLDDTSGEVRPTERGRMLKRIYGERDLLIAECVSEGIWNALDAPALAAMACSLVFEGRRETQYSGHQEGLPRGPFRSALEGTLQVWARLDDLEHDQRLPVSEAPSPTLSLAMYTWARGASLDTVLRTADIAAGDFVRLAKQTIDICDQLSIIASGPLADTARRARDAVHRGIVAYSSVV